MTVNKKVRAGIVAGTAIGALALAGLAGSTVAHAADSTPSPTATSSTAPGVQGQMPQHAAEEALTGDTATKVEAAVKAKYPDATIDRMEKDSDGKSVYEAHITKADGTHATVMLDDTFTITGEDTHGPDGKGRHGGHGPDGQGMNHAAEEALTGDTATNVEAAVKAKYPDATIDRMEKDSDGKSVYEAHITKADGTHATVMLDDSFTITGENTHGPDGKGRHGGHGMGDMDQDGTGPNSSTAAPTSAA